MQYVLIRKKTKYKLSHRLSLKKGYKFKTTLKITLYNISITDNVLSKKINIYFKNILKLLKLLDTDDDGDSANTLLIQVETLRSIILDKYLPYLGANKIKVYLLKLQEIEKVAYSKRKQKTR